MIEKCLYSVVRPFLFSMAPETAHEFTMQSLRHAASIGVTKLNPKPKDSPRHVMGLTFRNPVGLAAGLDKDGAYIDGVSSMGFGFVEIGTITPRAQPGNPKPRMFRIHSAMGLINRMGFNNAGVDVLVENVQASDYFQKKKGILGINIGKNASTSLERAIEDYLICMEKVYPVADYIAVNISSPNTKGLRQLQEESELNDLLSKLKEAQKKLADKHARYVPITLKIAPDVNEAQIRNIADTLLRYKFDGVIATNTTIQRDAILGLPHATEVGGLSGAPVTDISTNVIRLLKRNLGDEIPIIGVGGIMSAKDAKTKIDAGASLIQLYTGLIYAGPGLVRECVNTLA